MAGKRVVKKAATSRARTPPLAQYPAWTEAKYWSFLRSALRSAASKWPPKWEVLKKAKRPYVGPDKRTKWEYLCNTCQQWKKQKEISVDHTVPAGSLGKYEDVVGFIQRLFVGEDGLQVLCSVCHGIKTQGERNDRSNS